MALRAEGVLDLDRLLRDGLARRHNRCRAGQDASAADPLP
jgi:hypothetical protein